MRCGKLDHQPVQRCPAKNAKCKECHKIGHIHKVCQSKKRATQRAHFTTVPQDDDDTHIDENGVRQPNPPPRVNMLKVANHNEANREKFNEGKHLKFPIASQGMTVFTIVDFKKGYWMVVLHPDSRKLTCMVLPFGRFQWTRLPMGTMVAQNIFQSKLDAIFISMEGVTAIADDIVIAGRDEMGHDRNFLVFTEKCMSNNLTLNAKKIQFTQSQVSFYGHCWSKQGISPDPKKIEALNHMEFPPDKETMRSFLGMVNYLNWYSVLSAHLAAPLSALTHQVVDYKPSKEHF